MDDTRKLVDGPSEFVFGLATHPRDPTVFATGSEEGSVSIWRTCNVAQYTCTAAGSFPMRR